MNYYVQDDNNDDEARISITMYLNTPLSHQYNAPHHTTLSSPLHYTGSVYTSRKLQSVSLGGVLVTVDAGSCWMLFKCVTNGACV